MPKVGLVGFAVLTSRVLGLVREQVFAVLFGAGAAFDAFVSAARLPHILRDMFAEGAMSASFVTAFSRSLETRGEAETVQFVNRVLHALLAVLAILTLVGVWLSPTLIDLIVPGFRAVPAKRELAISLARWMWPVIAAIFLAAFVMGTLNAWGRYAASAFASATFNVGVIFGGIACAWLLDPGYVGAVVGRMLHPGSGTPLPDATRAVFGMTLGMLVGAGLQIVAQLPSLRGTGYRYRPAFSLSDAEQWRTIALVVPVIVGGAATQVHLFVNGYFASELGNGRVAWLNYAFRLVQFPIGIFGVAVATTSLMPLARAAARRDFTGFTNHLASGLGIVLVLCVPSACGLAMLGEPIVAAIYQHGAFTGDDARETAGALTGYAVGLTGYAATKLLANGFYALGNTRTPAIVSLGAMLVNVAANFLTVRYGHRGLALSTSAVILLESATLLILLSRQTGIAPPRSLAIGLLKICLAAGGLTAVAWWIAAAWHPVTFAGRCALIVGGIIVAGGTFAAGCLILRIDEFSRATRAFLGGAGKTDLPPIGEI